MSTLLHFTFLTAACLLTIFSFPCSLPDAILQGHFTPLRTSYFKVHLLLQFPQVQNYQPKSATRQGILGI